MTKDQILKGVEFIITYSAFPPGSNMKQNLIKAVKRARKYKVKK